MTHCSGDNLVLRIEVLREERGRIVVAIDGRGGAGKSSLARTLVQRLPKSAHIEHDWFHFPKNQTTAEQRFDHNRLIAEVISPFRSGSRGLQFLRYNWGYLAGILDGFHETPVCIPDVDILVIEGCDTLHRSLAPHFDLRVWVDTPPAVSLERGIKRDIEEYHLDPARVRECWKEWSAWEDESLAKDDRRGWADVLV